MAFFIDEQNLQRWGGLREHHGVVVNMRRAHDAQEAAIAQAAGMVTNAARIGAEGWRDFDAQVKTLMTSGEDALMADLMPLARTVSVGRIVSEYKRIGDAELEVRTSIDGQHAKPVNRTTFDFDGVVIPVHSTQIGRNWRELEGMRADGIDGLRDDQEAAVRYVRERTLDNFVNGTADLQFKGYKAYGITNNPNTLAVNLGVGGLNIDLTSATLTYADAHKTFVALLQKIKGTGNNATGDVTFYLSGDIYGNLLRIANPSGDVTDTMLAALLRIPGIAGIKQSDRVTGNALFGMILSSQYVQPVVGMPITSTPISRLTPMDDFHVLVWGVSGLQIKADSAGRSGVLYASA